MGLLLALQSGGSISDSFTGTGGAVASGAGAFNVALSPTVTGGALGSGAAIVSASGARNDSFTGAGGALGSGVGILNVALIAATSGGASGSGAATFNLALLALQSGASVGSGSAVVTISVTYSASGGATGSGAATATRAVLTSPSGGALGSGTATFAYVAIPPISGGALGSGVAPFSKAQVGSPVGGAAGSGAATVNVTEVAPVSGGGYVSGFAIASIGRLFTPSGGAVGSGAADFSSASTIRNDAFTGLGGALGSGSAFACFTRADESIPTTVVLSDIARQVRELIGDYHSTTYSDAQIEHEIFVVQADISRSKGFNVKNVLFNTGRYPSGSTPPSMLGIKRVELVMAGCNDYSDIVIGVLRESSMQLEDAANEMWRNPSDKLPKRYLQVGNQQMAVSPIGPANAGLSVRVHYTEGILNYLDPNIPDYYYDQIRYGVAARLLMYDTDLQAIALAGTYKKMFTDHIAQGIEPLAVKE